MITEDYCSYELAKLLKEKGFDEESPCYYSPIGSIYYNTHWTERDTNWISRPTHQLACKWLREVHDVCIFLDAYHPFIVPYNGKRVYVYRIMKEDKFLDKCSSYYDTYEEATEAAIKYCLENLI